MFGRKLFDREVIETMTLYTLAPRDDVRGEGLIRGLEEGSIDVRHTDLAERAGRRLEWMADRLEIEAKRPGIDREPSKGTAQELRVAALLVRDEERETPEEKVAENLTLEAR